jgi:tetrahydromethanopterin S-methyltransferase subunit G
MYLLSIKSDDIPWLNSESEEINKKVEFGVNEEVNI